MNFANKKTKNCLIVFSSKRAANFESLTDIVRAFSSRGYFFDKVSQVAFDDSEEIVRALKDGSSQYENLVLYCPQAMGQTIMDFIARVKGGEFDGTGQLKSENFSAFVMYSDGECFLTVNKIADVLDKKYTLKLERAYVKTVGAPVKKINEAINKAKSICPDIIFNVTEKFGDCTIEIIYDTNLPKSVFDSVNRAIVGTLSEFIYALEDISLAERLVQLLKLRRMKICVAESFTGGGVCKRLVEISGVSEVFFEGLNTYSNEAKMSRLKVRELTLKQYGAVSEQTASEMALGLIESGNCDVSIATTGIAGPKSDNTNKPVGLLYIGIGLKDGADVYKYELKGTRENITETAINLALFLTFKTIK